MVAKIQTNANGEEISDAALVPETTEETVRYIIIHTYILSQIFMYYV